MAEKATLARPYARAAFEFAQAHGALKQWSESLAMAAAVAGDPAVTRLLNHPRVTAVQLVGLIAEVAGSHLDSSAHNFISTLAQNRRLGLLPQIAAMYETLRADVEKVADVAVVSAVPLEAAQQQRLTAALKTRLKRDVRLHCAIDATLMGGAVVRYGDLVIDGSVKERLTRLASVITN
ncbi:MAG: F0F1 ATP synthase subunit delta [Steroidobacteraceae bacterium]